jgi:hypothetical protein
MLSIIITNKKKNEKMKKSTNSSFENLLLKVIELFYRV